MPTSLDHITLGQVIAAGGPIASVWGFIAWAAPKIRRGARTLDDLKGSPARPGYDAQPGVLERMASQEKVAQETTGHVVAMRHELAAQATQLGGLSEQVQTILPAVAQLQPNHGGSLNDAITRIELNTARTLADAARATPHTGGQQ